VERHSHAALTLFHEGALTQGAHAVLSDDAAQHARVRRAGSGDAVRLLDGAGRVATGTIESIDKRSVTVRVEQLATVPRPTALEVLVPVADRDRMLWAAEKCVELQITGWRPVMYERSRSVSPRGEGARFREKVLARMRSALEQSGAAWLPDVHDETNAADAWGGLGSVASRYVLDVAGAPLPKRIAGGPAAIAAGPEGGFEPSELEAAVSSGWSLVSLGDSTLRFETAVVAAVAVMRAMQL
jgi:16S rRNA (uracil1498-N3)-methyltransferase